MKTVNVQYKFVGDAHFFVSEDERTVGLCVAHKDLKTAFDAVAPTLSKLFKANHDLNITFAPSIRFLEFRKQLVDAENKNNSRRSRAAKISGPGLLAWKQKNRKAA
ncbi:MAG: hypothetical protein OXQ29_07915 [Rhodospirillaceae bacterium]|nr:hypothetical protein [Rhodospirillaceae bacterium]